MSKIDFETANNMRADGATFAEIGERFGVSKQCVYEYLNSDRFAGERKRKNAKMYQNIYYKGLDKWFKCNEKLSVSKIAAFVFGGASSAAKNKIYRLLEGKDVHLTVTQIKRLMDASGMSFDELFEPYNKL